MIDFGQDIQSLSTFKRNTNKMVEQMRTTGNPLILTVNGKAEIIVQDAQAYQKLVNKIEHLEDFVTKQKELTENKSSKLINLYGAAADIEFALDSQGISDEMDDDLTGIFNE